MHLSHMQSTHHEAERKMKLKEWMDNEELSQAKMADMVGCDQATISRILAGNGCADEWKRRIYEITGGLVTPNDLFGLPWAS